MTEAYAALLGALIGAFGGLAGGGFAALASLRASQVAARAPLCSTLHKIAEALVRLRIELEDQERTLAQRDFQVRWNEFSIQQRILCPSYRIEGLSSLILGAARSQNEDPDSLLMLAGQTLEKVTKMVAAHSNCLFRWQALRQEAKIIESWLDNPESKILGDNVRTRLRDLAHRTC